MLADRWGVTDAETERHYPCDDIVPVPSLQAWRGVTVHAPPRLVWPWVTQVRLAPYSYDRIDNLARRSPQQLQGLPEPHAGEQFTTIGGRFRAGRILSAVPDEQLTARIIGAVMSYVLVPEAADTRLLLKIVTGGGRLLAPALSLGDLVMARRQLLNLKALAERDARAGGASALSPDR